MTIFLWALFYSGLPFITTGPGVQPYESVIIWALAIIAPIWYLFCKRHFNKMHDCGEPQTGRVLPSDPDSQYYSSPDRCPLCSLTFDAAGELKINLEKDGYGDCSFCPKCGRHLQTQAPTKEGATT